MKLDSITVSSCLAGVLGGFTDSAAGGVSLLFICSLIWEEFPYVATRVML